MTERIEYLIKQWDRGDELMREHAQWEQVWNKYRPIWPKLLYELDIVRIEDRGSFNDSPHKLIAVSKPPTDRSETW